MIAPKPGGGKVFAPEHCSMRNTKIHAGSICSAARRAVHRRGSCDDVEAVGEPPLAPLMPTACDLTAS
jgi:hypothetical protein